MTILPSSHIRFAIYARKSTESEDRQVQSIEDQLSRLRLLAADRGLFVVRTYTEAKSAKLPSSRPVFAEVLSSLQRGDFDGLLCWQLNRLSRNPVDSGQLSWLLQSGKLRSILTIEREYRPEDNVLLFSVESGMANEYIRELSRNVRRGMLGKAQRGELPGQAFIGYLNDRLNKTVVPDPERFSAMKQAWKWMLTGNYSIPRIASKLRTQYGLTMPRRRRLGDKPITWNCLYSTFANPFYAGRIRYCGSTYIGKHKAMVSPAEFERVQRMLHRKDRLRPHKLVFSYSRLFTCGECGCAITAEQRSKLLKSTGRRRWYTYYHCTHKKEGGTCSQRAYIREEELTKAIAADLRRLAVRTEIHSFCLNTLHSVLLRDSSASAPVRAQLERALQETEHQLSELIGLRSRSLIGDAEFSSQRAPLIDNIERLKAELDTRESLVEQQARIEKQLHALVDVDKRFLRSSMEERRNILALVGSNRTIRAKMPSIEPKAWLIPILRELRVGDAGTQGSNQELARQ